MVERSNEWGGRSREGEARAKPGNQLVKHKLINPSQHGFLKARSCLTNLLCFFEEITIWVDEGSPVDVIYLDLQKAFDKVPHQRLILKVKITWYGKQYNQLDRAMAK